MRQRQVEQCRTFGERPSDKAAANPHFLRLAEFSLEPLGIAISASDKAEAAGCSHCRCKLATSGERYRRRDDRMLNAEHFSQSRIQSHPRQFPSVAPRLDLYQPSLLRWLIDSRY